jgi:predicted RNA methylase
MSKSQSFIYTCNEELWMLKQKIKRYFRYRLFKKTVYRKELRFLMEKADSAIPFTYVFPYPFVFDYDKNTVTVLWDAAEGLHYVMYREKRLYYKKDLSVERIKELHISILTEQDRQSPHHYFSGILDVKEGDVVADIGAAEGNFSLETVEKAAKIYIFETDEGWIEALNATFRPWKEKVRIVHKYVSDSDSDRTVTLQTALREERRIDYIKMDVEGAETTILKSSAGILRDNDSLKLAICAYHRQSDEREIKRILTRNRYQYTTTPGYMLFIYGEGLTPPYFRKGLILAAKELPK